MAVTKSEAITQFLCSKTFLRRWTIPNPQIDRGKDDANRRTRELCDAIVIFEKHVLLISDKASHIRSDGNLELNWGRWARRAIVDSARQLDGAEAWVRRFPNRVFRDSECRERISISDDPENLFFHRIVVANGAAESSSKHFGRNHAGFNIYSVPIADEHKAGRDLIIGTDPFTLIYPNHLKNFTHVFDGDTFKIIMDEFDTTSDLVDYFLKKQNFLLFHKVFCPGEVNMAAYFLRVLNENKEHDFVLPPRLEGYAILEAEYDKRLTNQLYLRKKEADKISYQWDSVIEYFEKLATTKGFQSDPGFETGMRILAARKRVERRYLARSLLDALSGPKLPGQRLVRGHLTDNNETAILFSIVHKFPTSDFIEYRELQFLLMELYAIQMSRLHPGLKKILLLGFESRSSVEFGNIWMMVVSPEELEISTQHEELIEKLRILQNVEAGVHTEKEYPDQG